MEVFLGIGIRTAIRLLYAISFGVLALVGVFIPWFGWETVQWFYRNRDVTWLLVIVFLLTFVRRGRKEIIAVQGKR